MKSEKVKVESCGAAFGEVLRVRRGTTRTARYYAYGEILRVRRDGVRHDIGCGLVMLYVGVCSLVVGEPRG